MQTTCAPSKVLSSGVLTEVILVTGDLHVPSHGGVINIEGHLFGRSGAHAIASPAGCPIAAKLMVQRKTTRQE